MTKQEIVNRLKKAYEAEYYFPGVLGNPNVFASRWRLALPHLPGRANVQTVANAPLRAKIIRELGRTKWICLHAGDSVSIHTFAKKGEKRRDRIISGVVVGTRGSAVRQKLLVKKTGGGGDYQVVTAGHICKIRVKRKTAERKGHFLRLCLP